MRRLFCTLLFAMLFAITLLSVNALAKSYTIELADFHVVLNEDGSADIHETWTVTYESGEFTRFFKTIYESESEYEKHFGHTTYYVKIDGVECEQTYDISGRPDYHFSLVDNGSFLEYSAYLKSSNVTRTYEFSYNRKGVVKCVNDEYYFFKHRFLSDGFKDNVENIRVTIETYDKENSSICLASQTEPLLDDAVYLYDSNVSDLYAVAVRVDGDIFESVPLINEIPSSEVTSYDNTLSDGGVL